MLYRIDIYRDGRSYPVRDFAGVTLPRTLTVALAIAQAERETMTEKGIASPMVISQIGSAGFVRAIRRIEPDGTVRRIPRTR